MGLNIDPTTARQILANLKVQRENLDQQIKAIEQALNLHGFESPGITIPAAPKPASISTVPSVGGRPRKFLKCTVPGCEDEHVAKGLCSKHYAEQRREEKRRLKAAAVKSVLS